MVTAGRAQTTRSEAPEEAYRYLQAAAWHARPELPDGAYGQRQAGRTDLVDSQASGRFDLDWEV